MEANRIAVYAAVSDRDTSLDSENARGTFCHGTIHGNYSSRESKIARDTAAGTV